MYRETKRGVLIACLGLPLLFVHTSWATALLQSYLLTAFLFGVLLVPEYPSPKAHWFWKAILVVVAIHMAVVVVLVNVDLEWATVLGPVVPARMAYALLGVILVAEWRVALYVIEGFEPKGH
jgi:hypothetical protein